MREIYIVNATQVVASETHPEGVYSTISGYPKLFDTLTYNDDVEKTLRMAQAEFYDRWGELLKSETRAAFAVTLERADGRQIERKSFGTFPIVAPEPEPEPKMLDNDEDGGEGE